MARIEHSPLAPGNSLDVLLKATNGTNRPPDKGTPEYYQGLVNYYLEKRKDKEGFWKRVEEQYRQSKFERLGVPSNQYDVIEPGRTYQMVHRTEAQLLGAPPKFLTRGFTAYWEVTRAESLQKGLNNEWDHDRELLEELALNSRDCSKVGWGIAMTTYDAEFLPDPAAQRKEADKRRMAMQDNPVLSAAAEEVAMEVAASENLGPTPVSSTTFEEDDRVLTDTINTRRISPWHFIVDPDCTSLHDAKWIGRAIICDLEAVKANKAYKNTRNLSPTERPTVFGDMGPLDPERWTQTLTHEPYELVTLYELWERKVGGGWRRVTIAKEHDAFLQIVEDPYWIGHPFSLLRWNQDGEEIFAQSDMLHIESERLAEKRLLTKMVEGYSNDQEDVTFFSEAAMSDEELYDATSGEPNRFVAIKNDSGQRLADMFHQVIRQPKSPDALNFLFAVQKSLEQSAGIGANQQAQALKSDTSAREVQEISANVRIQASHKERAFENFVLDVARKRLGLMAQFYGKDKILRIAGEEAAQAWPENWTEGDVQQGLMIFIEKGSMRPRDDMMDFQSGMQLAQLSMTNPMWMGNTNLVRLQKFLYSKLLGTAGEAFILSTDEASVNQAVMNSSALQMAGGGGSGSGAKPPPPKSGGGG